MTQPQQHLPIDPAERKRTPIYSGFLKYFPDAIVAVAQLSFAGNEKHNPGQPLHWSRDKSNDHLDCVARHLLDAEAFDPETQVFHATELAWRALAHLQITIENARLKQNPDRVPVQSSGPVRGSERSSTQPAG